MGLGYVFKYSIAKKRSVLNEEVQKGFEIYFMKYREAEGR